MKYFELITDPDHREPKFRTETYFSRVKVIDPNGNERWETDTGWQHLPWQMIIAPSDGFTGV